MSAAQAGLFCIGQVVGPITLCYVITVTDWLILPRLLLDVLFCIIPQAHQVVAGNGAARLATRLGSLELMVGQGPQGVSLQDNSLAGSPTPKQLTAAWHHCSTRLHHDTTAVVISTTTRYACPAEVSYQ